jgi:hypothetical protein
MRRSSRFLVGALAASAVIFTVAAVASAETCTLELKRLDQQARSNSDNTYQASYPQSFYTRMLKGNPRVDSAPGQAEAFKRIVKKEPKYQSENPFRGIAKLGSQQFAFVLDVPPPPSNDKKPDAKKEKKEEKNDSVAVNATAGPQAIGRLYFDLNNNGDLTDDKVIEAEAKANPRSAGQLYAIQFPRVDVTLDNNGTKSDYSFFMHGEVETSPNYKRVSVSLNAGAYREGHITLGGKKHHVALLDFNSNGRFDDEMRLISSTSMREGKAVAKPWARQGDLLLVDPKPGQSSPYIATSASISRNNVSKMVNIEGRFYDMKISPSGDKLTLEPSSISVGKMTNPSGPFGALIYGNAGFLVIRGNKNTPAEVPVGEWKLLSYTLEPTAAENKNGQPPAGQHRLTYLTAQAGDDYKAVKVVKGETVALPFGPPYKPRVTTEGSYDRNQLWLGLTLIGSAGEACSDLIVDGRPPSPLDFTITDPKGKEVKKGSFEYG